MTEPLPFYMDNVPNTDPSIPGSKTFLLGTPGGGKTKSLETWIETGLEVFCIFTEPMDTISKEIRNHPRFHYVYIPPAASGFASLLKSAKSINTMNQKMLAQLSDIEKSKYGQFIKLLEAMSNFTDQRGECFGGADTWGTNSVLVVDSLSGVNVMAMDLVVGGKPMKSQGDWGIAMDNLGRLINQLTSMRCQFVLTGHLSLDKDELTGRMVQGAATLGKKLAPDLPRFFSDVVKAYRVGDEFLWATKDPMVDLKFRLLPNSDKIEPSFVPIFEEWKTRAATDETQTVAS